MRKIIIPIMFLFLANLALADGSVMLVTDITSVDAATASAAASKAGVPVLILEDGMLNDAIKSEIKAQGFSGAILVGGPVVVKAQVAEDLTAMGLNVVRLWGFERTGTAVAVARYFWPEGGACAVLVDDTRNSEADSRRQSTAANLAAARNCTLVPVPEGTVPAEVLSLLQDLNITDVHFVGKRVYGIKDRLASRMVREIAGDDDEIEERVENETASPKSKLVIVATPDWKAAVAIASQPNDRSVVKHKTDANVSDIIEFVRKHNITDIRVVGLPQLAGEIVMRLSEAGINATKVSGKKADEISRELIKKTRIEWEEKRSGENDRKEKFKLKIKISLDGELNDTIAKLDAALAELEAANATENAKTLIEAARAKINETRSRLLAGDIDGARRLIFEIKFTPESVKLKFRDELKTDIEMEVSDEENGREKISKRTAAALSDAESMLNVKERCGQYASFIEKLLGRVNEARQQLSGGDVQTAHRNAKMILNEAKQAAKACEKPASVRIKDPKDGSSVKGSTVAVEVDADNFNLVPATKTAAAGEGHFHVYLDDREQRGPKKKFVFENIAEGIHGLRVELHLSDHTAVEGAFTQAVITVEKSGSAGSNGTSATTNETTSGRQKGEESGRMTQSTVRIKSSGGSSYLEPRNISVKKGSAVTWTNEGSERHWIATALHPTHTVYPGSNIEKCGTEDAAKIFDSCRGISPGENYTFVFKEKGSWQYHDHLNPSLNGVVTVVE